jgi:hypothetical protein
MFRPPGRHYQTSLQNIKEEDYCQWGPILTLQTVKLIVYTVWLVPSIEFKNFQFVKYSVVAVRLESIFKFINYIR